MRIWIVSDGEPLPTDGVDTRLRRMGLLAEILQSRDHEVRWFSSAFHHYKKIHRSDNNKTVLVKENYYVELLKTKGYQKNVSYSRLKNYKELTQNFKETIVHMDKPDVIITTLAPLELSEYVIDFANENSIPVVVDVRDLWPDVYYEVLPEKLMLLGKFYVKYLRNRLKKNLRNTTSIIGVTPYFLQYGLDVAEIKPRPQDKVFYTSYKPLDLSVQTLNFHNEWSEYNLSEKDFTVIFLGNFGKQFELEPIIEAANLLKDYGDIKFVLCGTGENLENFKMQAQHLENVIFPGWIDKDKITTLMTHAKLGVAPYRDSINFTKNTPNKFGEYLAASLPILVGIGGIMQDLLEQEYCGYRYKSSNDLANKILELYNNQEELYRMSNNAIALFDKKFNADKVYTELAIHLENLKINQREVE